MHSMLGKELFRTSLIIALALPLCATLLPAAETGRPASNWVYAGPGGKLAYKTTPAGDRIMDFSHAGYMGGGVAIPAVPVQRTVHPSGGPDDGASIQAAIDEVSALPLDNGFRGAVLLAPGTFIISRTLTISAGGVVLRGSGSGREGDGPRSTLRMTGRPHLAISVRGSGEQAEAGEGFTPAQTTIAEAYVPSGAMAFTVADASGFAAGDTLSIRRPVTEAWVRFMEMHDLVREGRPQTWIQTRSTINTERNVAAISGNRITLDAPLADSYDSKFLNPPGTAVVNVKPPARVSQVGIEQLHIAAPPLAVSHTEPHFRALRINGEDCWARDLLIEETMNSVGVGGRRITLERIHIVRTARSQGSSRPAKFAPNGTQILVDRCSVQADNVWFVATGGRLPGPIVILNCEFRGESRVESHQRWATGMLYDNVRVPEGGIEFRNRGSMGSGHGWSMGWGVAWNCVARDFIVQSPPGAPNWMIGNTGQSRTSPRPFGSGPHLPEGIKDSHGTPVTPKSLYLAQLLERLGPQALKNIGY
jgi:hypothetical protein